MIQYGYMETKDKCMKIEWGRAEFSVIKNRKHMQLNQIELEWMGSIKININR